jgi:hypothetical protein
MGLFAAIIFAEKVWSKGGLWIARITGAGFIIIGILSWTGIVSLPFNSMNNLDGNRMSMSMPMSTQKSDDMKMSHSSITKNSSISGYDDGNIINNNNVNSKSNDMTGMIMKMIMVITIYQAV